MDGASNALRASTCTLTLTHGALKVDRLLSRAGQCKEAQPPPVSLSPSRGAGGGGSLGLFMVAKDPGTGVLVHYCSCGCRVEELRLIDEQPRVSVNRAFLGESQPLWG